MINMNIRPGNSSNMFQFPNTSEEEVTPETRLNYIKRERERTCCDWMKLIWRGLFVSENTEETPIQSPGSYEAPDLSNYKDTVELGPLFKIKPTSSQDKAELGGTPPIKVSINERIMEKLHLLLRCIVDFFKSLRNYKSFTLQLLLIGVFLMMWNTSTNNFSEIMSSVRLETKPILQQRVNCLHSYNIPSSVEFEKVRRMVGVDDMTLNDYQTLYAYHKGNDEGIDAEILVKKIKVGEAHPILWIRNYEI